MFPAVLLPGFTARRLPDFGLQNKGRSTGRMTAPRLGAVETGMLRTDHTGEAKQHTGTEHSRRCIGQRKELAEHTVMDAAVALAEMSGMRHFMCAVKAFGRRNRPRLVMMQHGRHHDRYIDRQQCRCEYPLYAVPVHSGEVIRMFLSDYFDSPPFPASRNSSFGMRFISGIVSLFHAAKIAFFFETDKYFVLNFLNS